MLFRDWLSISSFHFLGVSLPRAGLLGDFFTFGILRCFVNLVGCPCFRLLVGCGAGVVGAGAGWERGREIEEGGGGGDGGESKSIGPGSEAREDDDAVPMFMNLLLLWYVFATRFSWCL